MIEALYTSLATKFVEVDGLRLRYLIAGDGPVILCLHGASLGSSADVFLPALKIFAEAGFTAVAYDQPGFGESDPPQSHQIPKMFVREFLEALGIRCAALIGHSRAGNQAVELALKDPALVTHVAVVGTGSLLPPLGDASSERESAAQQEQEHQQARDEPTIDETRKLLEADLFNHDVITAQLLKKRHGYSIGRNFTAFAARQAAGISNKKPKNPTVIPTRKRLGELKMPLLMMYGRQDRAQAGARAVLLQQAHPELNVHIIEGCRHLVPLDATEQFTNLVISTLRRSF